jgi:transposase InsO family protein
MLLQWLLISRQGAHQAIKAMRQYQCDILETVSLALVLRRKHPQMGCRDMYWAKRTKMPRGRDWTEKVLFAHSFRVKQKLRSFTIAGKDICSNLIEGMEITGINQVWQTDITYVWVKGRWYFVSFVIDVFNRRIVASHTSCDLTSKSQIKCLHKAVRALQGQDLRSLIIHTDRGVQYTSLDYKAYLEKHSITHSMAHYAWENAYCERVNRTIKHNYLNHYKIDSYKALCVRVGQAVDLYNSSKPHKSLPSRLSPDDFLRECQEGKHSEYKVKIWSKLTSDIEVNTN